MDRLKQSSIKRKKKPKSAGKEGGNSLCLLQPFVQKETETSIDRRTADRLIREHEPFIKSIATRWFLGKGIPLNELMQCGREGFYKAILRYRNEYEVKLSTYAYQWVYGAMANRARAHVREQREQVGTQSDLGERMGRYLPRSSDVSLLFQQQQPNPETIVLFRELAAYVQKRLRRMTHRQRLVVCRVTGFMDRKGPQTMAELAGQLDLSKQAIDDSKKYALQRLRISEAYLTEIATAEELMQAYHH